MSRVKDISIEYIWDIKTYIKGSKSLYNDMLKSSPKRFIGWFFIALVQFGLVAFLKKGAFGILFVSTILLLYWYLLRWQLRKFLLLRAFKKSSLKDKVIKVTAGENGLQIDGISIKWEDMQKILIEDSGYLLYYEDNYIFIPLDAFRNSSQNEKFLNIIKRYAKTQLIEDRRDH